MNFDVLSMKQRAKGLLSTVKPNPLIGGAVLVIYGIIMFLIMIVVGNTNSMAAMFGYLLVYLVLFILFMTSIKWFSMKASREEVTVTSDFFMCFKEKQGKLLVVAIVKSICIYFGMAFCFVGAFLPFYWFRFVENIVKDDDTCNPFKAMGKSMKLMKGHYLELIKIDLSLLGWWVLYIVTFGIAGIYIIPYTSMLYAEFYDYIKGQYEVFNA